MNTESLTVLVAQKDLIAQDICRIELVDPEDRLLPAFTAGAHVDVHLRDGVVRQYSLCNSPVERHRYVLGVQRDPQSRGGSVLVHDAIAPGDHIRIGLPRNRFALTAEASHHLLIGAGIGITPILSMAEALHASKESFELHYCARTSARMAFLDQIAGSAYADRTRFYLDDAPDQGQLDIEALLAAPDAGRHLYVCGPAGFIDLILTAARAGGWADTQLHSELFSAPPASGETAVAFDVKLARDDRVIHVPGDKTVLQALAEAGIAVPTFCGQGLCGTCLTPVLSGTPDHRDHYLTEEERNRGDQFLPCCSRSLSPMLVLDL